MHYPSIDPVIVAIGPLAVRWYGLAYLAAFAVCWWLGNLQAKRAFSDWSRNQVADLVFYGCVGAVVGGRVGYVLFYAFENLLRDPLFLFRILDGGMSFHGGLLGVVAAMAWFAPRTNRNFWQVADFVAPLVPIGLGLGRLGNFANTELPGRVTEVPWGLIFPCDAAAVRGINVMCTGEWESFARHPSSLYQAFAEGLVLFAIVWWIAARAAPGRRDFRNLPARLRRPSLRHRVLPDAGCAPGLHRLRLAHHGSVAVAPDGDRWYSGDPVGIAPFPPIDRVTNPHQ